MGPASLAHNRLVRLFQPLEPLNPLFQGQRVHGRHPHRPIDPVRSLAAKEIEVSARFLQPGAAPAPEQLILVRFQGEGTASRPWPPPRELAPLRRPPPGTMNPTGT